MDFVPYAVPFFILAMVAELTYGLRVKRNTYRVNDAVGSLLMGTLSQARRFITLGVAGFVYWWVAEYFSLEQMSPTHWWTWVLATVLYDLCYYWFHRISHERTIFWASHVAHHQSEDYNLSTALRQTSTGFLLGWIFYVPMFLIGIPAEVVVSVGSLNLIYQFWVHTEHVPKLGWYEWLFVTPSNHRVHHAQNERYLDRNYGGLFIIWDRLFGTFQEELDDEPPIYGIRGAIQSFNPLKAITHIYIDMAQDCWRASNWRDRLRVLVSRTGWRPADLEARYPRMKTDLSSFQRFDPPQSLLVKVYALAQLLVTVLLLFALQSGAAVSSNAAMIVALFMLWTGVCAGLWLDGRHAGRALALDAARLLCVSLWLWSATPLLQPAEVSRGAMLYLTACSLALFFLARSGSDTQTTQPA